jgi:hypothetical protein
LDQQIQTSEETEVTDRSNRSWKRSEHKHKVAVALREQLATGAAFHRRQAQEEKKAALASARIRRKLQCYLDLPNFFRGSRTLEETKQGIVGVNWPRLLEWIPTLAPEATRARAFAAAYTGDILKSEMHETRKELEAVFRLSGWRPAPFVLAYHHDVDGVLMQHMQRMTGEYLRRELAAGIDLRLTLLLVTGDADYFDLLNAWHEEFGDAIEVHLLSPKGQLSQQYLYLPWTHAHYWDEVLNEPASP